MKQIKGNSKNLSNWPLKFAYNSEVVEQLFTSSNTCFLLQEPFDSVSVQNLRYSDPFSEQVYISKS